MLPLFAMISQCPPSLMHTDVHQHGLHRTAQCLLSPEVSALLSPEVSTGLSPVCLLLLYNIATVFQLYHGSDMMYEMRRRKPEPTLLLTEAIFNLQHHIDMILEELAFDDAISCTQR